MRGFRLLREWAAFLMKRRAVRTLTVRRNGSHRTLTWGRQCRNVRVPLCSQLISSCGCLFANKDSPADGKPRFIFLWPARNFLCRFSFACLHVCAYMLTRVCAYARYTHMCARADDVDGEWNIYTYIFLLFSLFPKFGRKAYFFGRNSNNFGRNTFFFGRNKPIF